MTYQEKVEALKTRLYDRLMKLLNDLIQAAKEMGYQVGPIDDFTDEQFAWGFVIHPVAVPEDEVGKWHETDLDLKLTIAESLAYEGEETGVSFRLEYGADGGRHYRVIVPYNYTPMVWVDLDDEDAVNERLTLVEADAGWVLEDVIQEHLETIHA